MSNEYLNNKAFETIINRFQNSKKALARHQLILEEVADTYKRKEIRGLNSENDQKNLNDSSELKNSLAKEFDESQQFLAIAFYRLSENIVKYAKFNLIDEDDAVQEGVMICFEKVDRFNPTKGKAFNYMTTCILNHFRQLYRTARNYNELKRKYQEYSQIQNTSNGKPI